jgi:oligopeptide/dipeptide ABC transporter ATP-binding protein
VRDALLVSGLEVVAQARGRSGAVLQDVDLAVPPGQVLGLIGESGSGKTTLANAILGVLPGGFSITKGSITVGSPAAPPGVRQTAYIPQDPSTALDPLFTIGAQADDILKARRPDLGSRALRRACAVAYLGLTHLPEPARLLSRRPHEVSGGQRQRLMIALALMVHPVMIVADEPTTALDLTIQAQVLRLLRDLVEQRRVAMLMTTHDPGVAHEICDRVAVMYAGRVVEQADTATILRRPAHPYTRLLLAASAGSGRARSVLPGLPPTPFDRPGGCAFHPRCPECLPRCATEAPPVVHRGGHSVKCWHAVPG